MNDGGPAFPGWFKEDEGIHYHHGMSLRDWFAGKALQGELASQNAENGEWPEGHESALAERCYKIADAMLKEAAK